MTRRCAVSRPWPWESGDFDTHWGGFLEIFLALAFAAGLGVLELSALRLDRLKAERLADAELDPPAGEGSDTPSGTG